MYFPIEAKRVPLWMTSPMTSAMESRDRWRHSVLTSAILLLFAIVLEVCLECITSPLATPLLRNAAISRLGDHRLVSQKIKVLRSRWKSVRVCFRVRPTRWRCLFCAKMTSSRCHAHLLTCYVKNKGAPIALKICTIVVWTSADTVAVLVFRNYDVITWPRPLAHMRYENSKCSDCAETRHPRSRDIARSTGDKYFL